MSQEIHRAKNFREGQSHTQMCCLSCINSFPFSAIKNSHETQFIFLQYASFPSLGLVYTLKVVFSQANRDDYQFFHGTPHAKLFIAQGLYYTHLPARMWNYWSELSFFFFLHSPTSIWKKSNYRVLFYIQFSLGSKFLGSHIPPGVYF